MAANGDKKDVTPDELRRLDEDLSSGNADMNTLSRAQAYQCRVLAQVQESMVTRYECEQRHANKWNWKAIAALSPAFIALFAFILKVTGVL